MVTCRGITLFGNWAISDLRNAIWIIKNGSVAKGGYPLEWYEDELERRTGSRRGFHEEEEYHA